jgi:alcohol dehydrogenase class IV
VKELPGRDLLINDSLDKAVNKPDLESRSKMLIASLMGAVAFQKGLGVVHSTGASFVITYWILTTDLANAVNIPYGMEFNIAGLKTNSNALQERWN